MSWVPADDAFGVYIHVPFCSVRCGYCDFNTYTSDELGEGATRASYADTVAAEIAMAATVTGDRRVDTVFFGGGTPTQLPPDDLVRMLESVKEHWSLGDDVEVTTEANPDSTSREALDVLRSGGFTRISFGVQSARQHVLDMLDRTHDPARVPQVVQWARAAGFEQVSLDLIYGTPGESMDDWRASVEQAVELEPNHVSAYALIVEDGTAFARKVRRGEVVMPDDDETADKYLLADDLLSSAGLRWYELSNWARDASAVCRHNLLYWHSRDWWGIGPGAHGFLRSPTASRRFWNVKHPAAHAQRIAAGASPELDGETIDTETHALEDVMLRLRLAEGIEADRLNDVGAMIAAGFLERVGERVVLTRQGRLMADHVVRQTT